MPEMITVIAILIVILVLDQFINRKLIAILNIKESDLDEKYVNTFHKYVENIFYWVGLLAIIIAMNEFQHFGVFVFAVMTILFVFRTIMKWIYTRNDQTYILSAVTCGLLILGMVTYSMIDS